MAVVVPQREKRSGCDGAAAADRLRRSGCDGAAAADRLRRSGCDGAAAADRLRRSGCSRLLCFPMGKLRFPAETVTG
ncbi:hypothetical protein CgunFtcFv8_016827 [Champsocephalus gunnari]|uniref:Uncharacterized protein n=1 Tax=Champsocephalus gunnari TaxID=52237 RepID=A0AAN8CT54_CHAGU|nr:hypothetical protein CgunFtcFv8_016827 [Champsocephalus gunnari]